MKAIRGKLNQNGITLLEVLLSITILSIILAMAMSMFPQMGLMNQKNEEKSQATNTAKQVLVDWQNNQDMKNYLSDPDLYDLPEMFTEGDTHYYGETTKDNVKIKISIAKDSDLSSSPAKVHQTHFQLLNENNTVIGESFGYIVVED